VTFRLKPEAEPVIANIALYIAADNPSAARRPLDDQVRFSLNAADGMTPSIEAISRHARG
jgi:hypothetical protein